MSNLITDIIEGFIILAILCGVYGFSNDMMVLAGRAQKEGIISYNKFTKKLTE